VRTQVPDLLTRGFPTWPLQVHPWVAPKDGLIPVNFSKDFSCSFGASEKRSDTYGMAWHGIHQSLTPSSRDVGVQRSFSQNGLIRTGPELRVCVDLGE